ncbi:hypothetical protein [Mesorhizobium sp. M7A.F.Ce.TU.012.03.2.1]|uniref:hypothetical protein n=1 Tax=Mesorhizobium sp. M7A.F.Ce.TU.012.03.2.1 TaxID=2493681 RepID=UPI000FD95D7F|nr:hypothetical protein [Mesorhizobium sp. M7A.F.Ce.TU.012.03.2.1]AZV18148.1 hypothetical protein EJ079_03090 [Mesorhizobium sp. M7A.F.Ce.TU.012.03.2.1]
MAKDPTKVVRTITDQVELIDWLVEQVKATEPTLVGAREVQLFDSIAEEFKYGRFCAPMEPGEYLSEVFDDIADQDEKVECSARVRWVAAEALGYVFQNGDAGAECFIALMLDALDLTKRVVATKGDDRTRFKSTLGFRERFGFRCDVTVKNGEYVD